MKTKLRYGKSPLLVAIVMAALGIFSGLAPARADQAASAVVASQHVARARPSMNDTYAARETKASDLAKFKGGDRVVIAGSTLVVVLLIVLIIVII